mgnify:CR=1 FL=1
MILNLSDELPFCWYFSIQSADKVGKKVDFINKQETSPDYFEIDNFVDPLYAMIGFVMRNPRVFIQQPATKYLNIIGHLAFWETNARNVRK